ncbi:hypothetical protein P4S72_12495 [Vibrio sp. PP-XX7]
MKKTQPTILAAIICSLIGVNGCYAAQSSQDLKNIQNIQGLAEDILINGDFREGDTGWWTAGGTFSTSDQMGCITFTDGGQICGMSF